MEQEHITQEALDEMLGQVGCNQNEKTLLIDGDDSFGFKCKRCGSCCMNRNDIILNPFDIYNGAKYLGIDAFDFLKEYTYGMLGSNSKIPIVLLRSQENGYCPLLEFDAKNNVFGCKINDAKPGACSNHPIGVLFNKNITDNTSGYQFIKVDQCDNSRSSEMHVVKDWVKKYIDNAEEIQLAFEMQGSVSEFFNPRHFYAFFSSIINTFKLLDQFGLTKIDDAPEILKIGAEMEKDAKLVFEKYTEAVYALYFDYDISQDFIPQAKENLATVREYLKVTNEIYENFKSAVEKVFKIDINQLMHFDEEVENEQ